MSGYVYILHFRGDIHKVGKANRLSKRLAELRRDLKISSVEFIGSDFEIKHKIHSQCPSDLERAIHIQFMSKRCHGMDYFHLTEQDIQMILSFGDSDGMPPQTSGAFTCGIPRDKWNTFEKAITIWKARHGEPAIVAHGDKKRHLELAMNAWADGVLAEGQ